MQATRLGQLLVETLRLDQLIQQHSDSLVQPGMWCQLTKNAGHSHSYCCPLTDLPGSTLASNTTIGPSVTLDSVPAYWGQSSTAGGSNQIDVTVELSHTIQALMQRTWDSHLIGVGKDGNGMTHRRTQVFFFCKYSRLLLYYCITRY